MPEGVITLAAFLVMAAGLAGSVLPGLPGLPVIFLAALGHKLLLPGIISWWLILWLGVIALAGVAVDFLAGWAGARMFGATKWGIYGAILGLLLGIPFSIPGMILGPVVGAVVAEVVVAKRTWKQASKSGVGAGVGFALSTVIHLIMGLVMVGSFAVALFVG